MSKCKVLAGENGALLWLKENKIEGKPTTWSIISIIQVGKQDDYIGYTEIMGSLSQMLLRHISSDSMPVITGLSYFVTAYSLKEIYGGELPDLDDIDAINRIINKAVDLKGNQWLFPKVTTIHS